MSVSLEEGIIASVCKVFTQKLSVKDPIRVSTRIDFGDKFTPDLSKDMGIQSYASLKVLSIDKPTSMKFNPMTLQTGSHLNKQVMSKKGNFKHTERVQVIERVFNFKLLYATSDWTEATDRIKTLSFDDDKGMLDFVLTYDGVDYPIQVKLMETIDFPEDRQPRGESSDYFYLEIPLVVHGYMSDYKPNVKVSQGITKKLSFEIHSGCPKGDSEIIYETEIK